MSSLRQRHPKHKSKNTEAEKTKLISEFNFEDEDDCDEPVTDLLLAEEGPQGLTQFNSESAREPASKITSAEEDVFETEELDRRLSNEEVADLISKLEELSVETAAEEPSWLWSKIIHPVTKKKYCFTKLLNGFQDSRHPQLAKTLNEATEPIHLAGLHVMLSLFGLSLEAGTCILGDELNVMVIVVHERCKKDRNKMVVVHRLQRTKDNHLHVCDNPDFLKRRPNHFRSIDPASLYLID
jgi:hypothetical protein